MREKDFTVRRDDAVARAFSGRRLHLHDERTVGEQRDHRERRRLATTGVDRVCRYVEIEIIDAIANGELADDRTLVRDIERADLGAARDQEATLCLGEAK